MAMRSYLDGSEALDVWLRFDGRDDEYAEAEANTYRTGTGYRVEWYLNAVGLTKSVEFDTLDAAYSWLERNDFQNFSN